MVVSLCVCVCYQASQHIYHRSGFDCEILMIANCEFFWSSHSKELQNILEHITIIWYGIDHCSH